VFVCIVVGSPVWVCGLLGLLFNWAWAWAVCGALLAFWWLPGMPYFAVCVSITIIIKRIFQKYRRKHPIEENHGEKVAEESADASAEGDKTKEK
jgi:hypothetical protein